MLFVAAPVLSASAIDFLAHLCYNEDVVLF